MADHEEVYSSGDPWGTKFYKSALLGRLDLVTQLLSAEHSEGANVNHRFSEGRYTALMAAVWNKRKAVVEHLLNRPDCDVNLTCCDGNTALILAYAVGNDDVCALLLARPDIEVNAVNHEGFTALTCGVVFAAGCSVHAVGRYLVSRPRDAPLFLSRLMQLGPGEVRALARSVETAEENYYSNDNDDESTIAESETEYMSS